MRVHARVARESHGINLFTKFRARDAPKPICGVVWLVPGPGQSFAEMLYSIIQRMLMLLCESRRH